MRHLISGLLVLSLIVAFGAAAKAAGFPYVFNITCADSSNPGKDESGNGNDAELMNDAEWVSDGGMGAIKLDGDTDYLEVMVDVPEYNFTMSICIKTDAPDVGVYSVLEQPAGAGGHDRHFFLVGGKINFRTWQGGAWPTDAEVADGEWHQITLVVEDGVGQTAYVDGEEVGTNAYDHSDFDWQDRVWIGFSNDAANDYFNGLIRNAVYIDQALTAAEVRGLITAVEPESKLITTWSNIKISY